MGFFRPCLVLTAVPAFLWEARRYVLAAACDPAAVAPKAGLDLVHFVEKDTRLTDELAGERGRVMASSLFCYDLRPSIQASSALQDHFGRESGLAPLEPFDTWGATWPGIGDESRRAEVCRAIIARCDAVYEEAARRWPGLPPWDRLPSNPGHQILMSAETAAAPRWYPVFVPAQLLRRALAASRRDLTPEAAGAVVAEALTEYLEHHCGGA